MNFVWSRSPITDRNPIPGRIEFRESPSGVFLSVWDISDDRLYQPYNGYA